MILLERKIVKKNVLRIQLLLRLLVFQMQFYLLNLCHFFFSEFVRIVTQASLIFIFFHNNIHILRIWLWKGLKSLLIFILSKLTLWKFTFPIKAILINSSKFWFSHHLLLIYGIKSFHSFSKTSASSISLNWCVIEIEILIFLYSCLLFKSTSRKIDRLLQRMTRFFRCRHYLLIAAFDFFFWEVSLQSHSIEIFDFHYLHRISNFTFRSF